MLTCALRRALRDPKIRVARHLLQLGGQLIKPQPGNPRLWIQARSLHPALRKRAVQLQSEYGRLNDLEVTEGYNTERALRLARLQRVVEQFEELVHTESEIPELEELSKDAALGEDARQELAMLRDRIGSLEKDLVAGLVPTHKFADKACLLEIRPGIGGSEATLFAADLLQMYENWCIRHHWKYQILSLHEHATGGITEAILHISEFGSYGQLQFEGGVHRVQRVPATEQKGRVHTSTAAVVVLPDMGDQETPEMEFAPGELRIDVMRASGSGGQHVNTTESAVRIVHIPTGMIVTCQDERSQHKNRAKALRVLRGRLAEHQEREQQRLGRAQRTAQVSGTDRSDKIRTYNYPQNRITDHRAGWSSLHLSEVMAGELDGLLDALKQWAHSQAIQVTVETANISESPSDETRTNPIGS